MDKKYENKQHQYASYAMTNNLKRLKLYYQGAKQLHNFYLYIDLHKALTSIKDNMDSNLYDDYKLRSQLEVNISSIVLSNYKGYYPSYYYKEVCDMIHHFNKIYNDYCNRLNPIDVYVYSNKDTEWSKDYIIHMPKQTYNYYKYKLKDTGEKCYTVYKGKEYQLYNIMDVLSLFNNYNVNELNT